MKDLVLNIEIKNFDELIEKLTQIKNLLNETNLLIESINEKGLNLKILK